MLANNLGLFFIEYSIVIIYIFALLQRHYRKKIIRSVCYYYTICLQLLFPQSQGWGQVMLLISAAALFVMVTTTSLTGESGGVVGLGIPVVRLP